MDCKVKFDRIRDDALSVVLSAPILSKLGRCSAAQLRQFALQFHAFVDYFPKYLGALIWQSPSESLRLAIVDNLLDESGGVQRIESQNTADTHPELFRRFGYRLGVTREDFFNPDVQRPYTAEMLHRLVKLSVHSPFIMALGGVSPGIENIFYTWIEHVYNQLKCTGFFEEPDLIYFSLHAKVDIEHAAVFRKQIVSLLHTDHDYLLLRQGALTMAQILRDFFVELEAELDAFAAVQEEQQAYADVIEMSDALIA